MTGAVALLVIGAAAVIIALHLLYDPQTLRGRWRGMRGDDKPKRHGKP